MENPEINFTPDTLMRSWFQDDFLVELYETGVTRPPYGHTLVGYRLYDIEFSRETGDGSPIFEGIDYGIPAGSVLDDDEAVRGINGFLSCRTGDTDDEYFTNYTPRQWAWMEARAERLSWWAMDDIDMETGRTPDDGPTFDDPDSYTRPDARPDKHGNVRAEEGCTRCPCGAKYWEHDICVSCGTPLAVTNDNEETT